MTLDGLKDKVRDSFAARGLRARVRGRTTNAPFGGQWPPEIDPRAQAAAFQLTVMLIRDSDLAIAVPHTDEHLGRLRQAEVPHSNFRDKPAFAPDHPAVAAFAFPFACRNEPEPGGFDELVSEVRRRFGL